MMAYVEWFTPLRPSARDLTGLLSVQKAMDLNGEVQADIISAELLMSSAHLIPKYSTLEGLDRKTLTTHTILDSTSDFLFNHYKDRNMFYLVDK